MEERLEELDVGRIKVVMSCVFIVVVVVGKVQDVGMWKTLSTYWVGMPSRSPSQVQIHSLRRSPGKNNRPRGILRTRFTGSSSAPRCYDNSITPVMKRRLYLGTKESLL